MDIIDKMIKIKKLYSNMPTEIKKARKDFFRDGNKGDKLYVYYDVDTIDVIVNNTKELWFKSADSFTDIEEHNGWGNKFFYVLLYLDKKKYLKKFKDIVKDAFKTYDINSYLNRYYILCSSYEPDNNTCWNTFLGNNFKNVKGLCANGDFVIDNKKSNSLKLTGNFTCKIEKEHTYGACICFNRSSLEYSIKTGVAYEGYVSYDFKQMAEKFFDVLNVIYKMYKDMSNEDEVKYHIYELIDMCNLFYKNKFYFGEKEYRYVIDIEYNPDLKNSIEVSSKGKHIIKYSFTKNDINHITITNSKDSNRFKDYEIKLSKISFNEEGPTLGYIYED